MFKFLSILFVFSAMSVSAQAQIPAQPNIDNMVAFRLNGFELSGSEYWVYRAGVNFSYPDDVLWGFEGQSENEARNPSAPMSARTCAVKAYQQLVQFLSNPPAQILKLKEKGATVRFYLWTNDYTQAAPNTRERAASMWHWNSGETNDYKLGYWKWMSTVKKDGTCTTPQAAQIEETLNEALEEMVGQ